MKIKNLIIPILILVVLTSACQAGGLAPARTGAVPTPAKDKATVIGRVLSSADSKPFAGIGVHLAQVFTQNGNSAFALDASHSPSATSDQNGYFTIVDITPGDYVVVVGDPMFSYVIVPDDTDKNKAKLWTIGANKILDLQTIRVVLK
jgi:hypothetical protein